MLASITTHNYSLCLKYFGSRAGFGFNAKDLWSKGGAMQATPKGFRGFGVWLSPSIL